MSQRRANGNNRAARSSSSGSRAIIKRTIVLERWFMIYRCLTNLIWLLICVASVGYQYNMNFFKLESTFLSCLLIISCIFWLFGILPAIWYSLIHKASHRQMGPLLNDNVNILVKKYDYSSVIELIMFEPKVYNQLSVENKNLVYYQCLNKMDKEFVWQLKRQWQIKLEKRSKKQKKILIVGPQASGKTTIFKQITAVIDNRKLKNRMIARRGAAGASGVGNLSAGGSSVVDSFITSYVYISFICSKLLSSAIQRQNSRAILSRLS